MESQLQNIQAIALGTNSWHPTKHILALGNKQGGVGLAPLGSYAPWVHSHTFVQLVKPPHTIQLQEVTLRRRVPQAHRRAPEVGRGVPLRPAGRLHQGLHAGGNPPGGLEVRSEVVLVVDVLEQRPGFTTSRLDEGPGEVVQHGLAMGV